MSNVTVFEKSKSLIMAQAKKFMDLAKSHKAVNFEQEASFALQSLQANKFLAQTAFENADSLINAIHNVASIGLSLNPALKHAYLVPRDKKVCLDLSYKGLAHLAIESGSLKYVQAELVFQKDKFVLRGRGQEPIHERNPFDPERGDLIGAYCIAETTSGDFLVEAMPAKEIFAIRDRTQAYKAYKDGKVSSCPWVSDEGEMFKKTVIRRASKSWPMTNTNNDLRVSEALKVQDEAEGVSFEIKDVTPIQKEADEKPQKIAEIRELLKVINRTEERYLGHVERVHKREIRALEEMTEFEINQSLTELYELSAKATKKGVQSENA